MPNFTKTLNLEKPLRGEFYSIQTHNENSDKIDLAIEKITVPTIEHLQNMIELQVGDIVDIQGYYTAGDGAHHKRKIAASDDGSGVQLTNGLWANIVHSGEVNVSWFGAKGDGETDETTAIQKALNFKNVKKIMLDAKIYKINKLYIKNHGTELAGKKSELSYENYSTAFSTVFKPFSEFGDFLLIVKSDNSVPKYTKIKNIAFVGTGSNSNVSGVLLGHQDSISDCHFTGLNVAIKLTDLTNSTLIDRVSSVSCNFGLYSDGVQSTVFSVSNSRFRQNNTGVFISSGVGYKFDNCIIETNVTGVHLQKKENILIQNEYALFKSCYFENNSNVSLLIDNESESGIQKVTDINFYNCFINAETRAIEVNAGEKLEFNNVAYKTYTGNTAKERYIINNSANLFKLVGHYNELSSSNLKIDGLKKDLVTIVGYGQKSLTSNFTQKSKIQKVDKISIIDSTDLRLEDCQNTVIVVEPATQKGISLKLPSPTVNLVEFTIVVNNTNVTSLTVNDYEGGNPIIYSKEWSGGKAWFKASAPSVGNSVRLISFGYKWLVETISGTWSSYALLKNLDTPYLTSKMQQEGIYEDYVAYRDELHEYEKAQSQAVEGVAMMNELVEPQPSQTLIDFKNKYLG